MLKIYGQMMRDFIRVISEQEGNQFLGGVSSTSQYHTHIYTCVWISCFQTNRFFFFPDKLFNSDISGACATTCLVFSAFVSKKSMFFLSLANPVLFMILKLIRRAHQLKFMVVYSTSFTTGKDLYTKKLSFENSCP